MTVLAVVGAQWGDEGKGKFVDELSDRADYVVRYQGGANAGHRVVNGDDVFAFHLLPAGILHSHTTCVIGNGVVVDPGALVKELREIERTGKPLGRLLISERAHVVMPYHRELDRLEEESRGEEKIGTVLRGIGPAYVDRVARVGIRMTDMLDVDDFRAKLAQVLAQKNRVITSIYGGHAMSLEEMHTEYVGYVQQLRQYVADTTTELQQAWADHKRIVLEGAQGALLDVDFGTFPFVTSSNTVVGNASAGTGLPSRAIEHAMGVYKAYITRVGSGPMPTELSDSTGDALRTKGAEFGTTTGRARRCGWFDAVAGRYVARLNGFDSIAITKLDVLDEMETIRICTGYRLHGEIIGSPPANLSEFAACQPIYEDWPGWMTSTRAVRTWDALPSAAQRYLHRIEELLEVPIALVSVGPGRGETVAVRDLPL
jgi:adenylosuccinate synthase